MNTKNVQIEIINKHITATQHKIKKIAYSAESDWLIPKIVFAKVTPYQLRKIKKLKVIIKPENYAVQTTVSNKGE